MKPCPEQPLYPDAATRPSPNRSAHACGRGPRFVPFIAEASRKGRGSPCRARLSQAPPPSAPNRWRGPHCRGRGGAAQGQTRLPLP